jgi:hypothetical protein
VELCNQRNTLIDSDFSTWKRKMGRPEQPARKILQQASVRREYHQLARGADVHLAVDYGWDNELSA